MSVASTTLQGQGRSQRRRFALSRRARVALLAVLPLVIYLLALFVYPIASTLLRSVEGTSGGFTLDWYRDALTGTNLTVLITTIRIAVETAVACLILGYPLAYLMTRLKPLAVALVMLIVIVPQFISTLVRTYAWIIMLGQHGFVNETLVALHVPGAPFPLLYNETGVLIGMTYVLLPYFVLVLYAAMRNIDLSLIAAAASLGAGKLTTFRKVYLPLVMPGISSAVMLTMVLSLGYYLTPALMGGEKQTVTATLIVQSVLQFNQWNSASAAGVVLLALTLVGMGIARALTRSTQVVRRRRSS